MSDLEDRLRTVCKGGFLLHIALDRDAKGKWRATYRNTDNTRVNVETDNDPIEALRKAITPLRQPMPEPIKVPARARNDDII